MTWITFHHLVGRFETSICDLGHSELLVVRLLGGDDGSVGGEREVDTRVGHQVRLELGQIHVEGAVEAERGSDGGNDLSDETIQVGVGWSFDVEVATADVVDGLVVDHEGAIRMLQGGMGGQDRVVGLHDGRRDLGGRVDGELELGFLSEVDGQPFHKQGRESRARATTERVEYQETLET